MSGRGGVVIAVVAALIVGFSLGIVAGITVMRFGPPPPFAAAFGPRGGPGPEGEPGMPGGPGFMRPGHRMRPGPMLQMLTRELDLTAAQQTRIHDILERTHAHLLATRDSTHAAIERELTPAQRARWTGLEQRFQKTWRGRTGHPQPDDGRPTGGDPDQGEGR